MLKIYQDKAILKPKAVIFDTDNTLYLYEVAHHAAMKSVMKKAENTLGVSSQDFQEVFDLSRKEIKLQLGNTASSHSRLLYFQRAIEKLGMGTRIFLALDLEQTYWREFLGGNAFCYDSVEEFSSSNARPDLLFIKGAGVYTLPKFSRAKLDQLRCYYDVIVRLNINHQIRVLNDKEIDELLNWDLEKYRIKHAK